MVRFSSSPISIFPSDVPVWIVGGAVRDLLSHKAPSDWDLVAQMDVKDISKATGGKVVGPEGKQVCVFSLSGSVIEIGSLDGRSIESDLARRDFTVNAMAIDRHGRILDPFGGQKDLSLKRLRFVPELEDRLRDDPVRALRFCRFAATLGLMPMKDELCRLARFVQDNHGPFGAIPLERVGREMSKGLAFPEAFLETLGLAGLRELFLPSIELKGRPIPTGPIDLALSLGLLGFMSDSERIFDLALSWGVPSRTRKYGLRYGSVLRALSGSMSLLEAVKLLPLFDELRSDRLMELLLLGCTGNGLWKDGLDKLDTARSALERASQRGIPLSGGEIASITGPGPHVGPCLDMMIRKVLCDPYLSPEDARSSIVAYCKKTDER
ncbi:tRNA nucleotidyltransferase/poly(A) polymerase family protein [Dethiosulfovibrio salsuginis]|uniref:Poly A polymerase head domain-containing protein n=1 Tax=Dethiosulfovibrio salsuginis TaxID=561720 RepID=A0A1X7K0T1_9BACT|nr:CCA tRNA nucleotidyltransferase [Dethiosulfovibrio salsuginis]SMG34081.1 Poly A polymerase head domain-containing protein [Dethiosulfovibrio salsuginis]